MLFHSSLYNFLPCFVSLPFSCTVPLSSSSLSSLPSPCLLHSSSLTSPYLSLPSSSSSPSHSPLLLYPSPLSPSIFSYLLFPSPFLSLSPNPPLSPTSFFTLLVFSSSPPLSPPLFPFLLPPLLFSPFSPLSLFLYLFPPYPPSHPTTFHQGLGSGIWSLKPTSSFLAAIIFTMLCFPCWKFPQKPRVTFSRAVQMSDTEMFMIIS